MTRTWFVAVLLALLALPVPPASAAAEDPVAAVTGGKIHGRAVLIP